MKKILVADDEPNIVTALEFLLRKGGYAVEVARNGEEALARVERGAPDLVVLDVMMPLKSGHEVCREIRRRGQPVRILMLSARGGAAEEQKGLAAGADMYLVKPFSTGELLERIRRLLAS